MKKKEGKKMESGVIEVNGKLIKKKLLTRWTDIARECYSRNCNCINCDIVPVNSFHEAECNIKYYVQGYLKLGVKQ